MNKKIMIVCIIIIYFSVYIIWDIVCFGGTYNTAEEAIMKQKDVKVDRVVTILENKDYAVGIFNHDNITESRYLHKTEKGWKILYSKIFFFQNYRRINDYDIGWYKNKGRTLIYIYKNSKIEEDIIIPKDNINSEFECSSEKGTDRIELRWFLVLDDLPKDYTITIGDKSLKIK